MAMIVPPPLPERSSMTLESSLQSAVAHLSSDALQNEAQVRQSIILPILRSLGWDDSNPSEVYPEYPVDNRFVDYALTVKGKPIVFIEAKRVGALSLKAESQVFAYANHQGIPILVLTDGRIWDMYLSMAAGQPSERKFCHVDLVDGDVEQVVSMLSSFLARESVSSGNARRAAETLYESTREHTVARGSILTAWENLINDPPDPLLAVLLSEEVEKLAGATPADEDIRYFFAEFLTKSKHVAPPFATPPEVGAPRKSKSKAKLAQGDRKRAKPRRPKSITLLGDTFKTTYFVDGYCEVMRRLQVRDALFLPRFSAHPKALSKKGGYLAARNKADILMGTTGNYPMAKDLGNGWWVLGHGSSKNLLWRLKLACEVAGIEFDKDLVVEF